MGGRWKSLLKVKKYIPSINEESIPFFLYYQGINSIWVGKMIQKQQQSMVFSPFMDIYDLVVPKDNLLRQINELIDFSFVYEELKANYYLTNGRNAIDPISMFKYLLLKSEGKCQIAPTL